MRLSEYMMDTLRYSVPAPSTFVPEPPAKRFGRLIAVQGPTNRALERRGLAYYKDWYYRLTRDGYQWLSDDGSLGYFEMWAAELQMSMLEGVR